MNNPVEHMLKNKLSNNYKTYKQIYGFINVGK